MTLTFAIPDIHGRLDLLDAAIERITERSAGNRATIITLGDYVDRGPNSCQVLERLMGWKSESATLVSLKGNHEAMMWETCNHLAELGRWVENGGDRTLASYGACTQTNPDLRLVPQEHLEWIANLALMHVDRHRVFVHAGVDPRIPLDRQSEQTLLWKRYAVGFDRGHGNRHVVHGHHADPKAPIATGGKTNLDGLAWKTGRLVIGVFDDDRPGGAVEYLAVNSDPGWSGSLSDLQRDDPI
ncbi:MULTISPECIES: metallophosphoesterase [Bradyrhizobium]|uniref:Serine/threonine protein phosphatase 1 n=2 Tax=Bradyrhizobium TaxID=374 RepID=A0ABY0Q7G2_9BRAD|nr:MULTISPECIES: metallophosphoesterase [Bradyrhizobium]SDJ64588.1 serine/threonine protein phosphatase 1 [Bradyrhizobium ottawaense]SEC31907.1 serine/threonine protein phosphatase 1 [Bradyrhizobium lablabi]